MNSYSLHVNMKDKKIIIKEDTPKKTNKIFIPISVENGLNQIDKSLKVSSKDSVKTVKKWIKEGSGIFYSDSIDIELLYLLWLLNIERNPIRNAPSLIELANKVESSIKETIMIHFYPNEGHYNRLLKRILYKIGVALNEADERQQ